jgi:hypothetical protein
MPFTLLLRISFFVNNSDKKIKQHKTTIALCQELVLASGTSATGFSHILAVITELLPCKGNYKTYIILFLLLQTLL